MTNKKKPEALPNGLDVRLVGKSARQAPRPDMGRILGAAFVEGWDIGVAKGEGETRHVTFSHGDRNMSAPVIRGVVTRLGTLQGWEVAWAIIAAKPRTPLASGQAIVNALARESPRALRQRETAKKAKR